MTWPVIFTTRFGYVFSTTLPIMTQTIIKGFSTLAYPRIQGEIKHAIKKNKFRMANNTEVLCFHLSLLLTQFRTMGTSSSIQHQMQRCLLALLIVTFCPSSSKPLPKPQVSHTVTQGERKHVLGLVHTLYLVMYTLVATSPWG